MYTKKNLDPHAAREAAKYTHPIPSREYILSLFKKSTQMMTRQKIMSLLTLEDAEQEEALAKRLRAMCRDGQLTWSRHKGYVVEKNAVFLKGRVVGNKEGFGFVIPEDDSPDLFLSVYQMRQVFPQDRVLIRVTKELRKNRREAVIVKVLERQTKQLVAYCADSPNGLTATPADPRINQIILIADSHKAKAKSGHIVLLDIVKQPSLHHPAQGHIIKVMGNTNTPGIETMIAIQSNQLPYEWPESVSQEVEALKKGQVFEDIATRVDLRDLPFVTIDGSDSKDFDDAVYCQPEKKDWRLCVAIADVGHYVKLGTALDTEARLRGNSVYLPHEVIPMLPEILSSELCSLKPGVVRLCLVCDMRISQTGQLKSYTFYPATIQSKARLTYHQVTQYLASNNYPKEYAFLPQLMKNLERLYQLLFKAKQKRGAIELNLAEAQITLGGDGKIDNIHKRDRTIAHRIIEECMLIANVATAQFLLEKKVLALFRVHNPPTPEKLAEFKDFIHLLGIHEDAFTKEPQAMDFAKLLEKYNNHMDNPLIQTMLLRTMSQAVYSPNNKGHFGLAYPAYTHFTSPIRRYPDLIVHRAIYRLLFPEQKKTEADYDQNTLEEIALHCSTTERRAEEATRQVISALKCKLMQAHIGQSFEGRVSHVTSFGLFVELKENLVEGLVHVNSIKNDRYVFDAKKMMLEGQREGKIYRLGHTVRIRVVKVALDAHLIDFELIEGE